MSAENINRRLNIYINDREIVNSLSGIDREMAKVRGQMRNLRKGTDDYDIKLKELKDTYSKLSLEQSKVKKELSEVPSILDKIKKTLGPVTTGFLAAFSISTLVTGFVSKMNEAWRIVVGFDQKQADLAATLGKTRTQIAGLTLDAIKYGASTAYSSSEVSVLQTELARLGKTAPEIKAMTKDVLNAATALETDLGSAATLVGGQLNSYGENAREAGKYSDVMANSVNISATSYQYLATALPKVSAVAAQNNVTFEKLNATMGTLADQNIQAETAGTGFRNILLSAAQAGKPYQEMLDKVKNSADQSKEAVDLFGKENATVAVILANSTEKINENTIALENSAGSAEKLAKEKLNSIRGSIEGFSGAWEGFVLSLEKGDGYIAKAVRGIIDLGTSFLNLISPMERISDQLQKEQLDLNMLVSKITSTNIKNEERKQLLIELKTQYPDFIKNINIETVSNNDLNDSLNKINEQYVKRITLQKQVEKIEDIQSDAATTLSRKLEVQERLFKKLNNLKIKFNLTTEIDYSNLDKSSSKIIAELKKKNRGATYFSSLTDDVDALKVFDYAMKIHNKEISEETAVLNRQTKSLGINTEAQNEQNKALAEQAEILKKLRLEAKSLGMKEAMTATEQELKIWIAAYKEKQKYTGELSEEEKKRRAKALEEAKKHSEDLQKQYESSQKELLASQKSFEELRLGNTKDSYEKEKALLAVEYNSKIETLKLNAQKEQSEIEKLQSELKNPKNTKSDVAILQKTIDNKIAIQKEYNDTAFVTQQAHDIRLATLQEKYLNLEFKKEDEAYQKSLLNLKTKQNYELASITTLAEAKDILSQSLSADELSKITTLEEAKKKIKEQHLKEEYDIQLDYFQKIASQYQALLELDASSGFQLFSEEERDNIIQNLDQVKNKLSEIVLASSGLDSSNTLGTQADGMKALSGIDILGFNPEQWNNVFNGLDTFQSKLDAVKTVVGGLQNAFGMYFDFVNAGENRNLKTFESNTNKKKKELQDQLEKGYINQDIYNARIAKLDADLDKKKAEVEYKQAKRQKIMQAAQIISSTAQAIMGIWAQVPKFDFGISAGVLTGVVGALGAAQLATVLAQPLPSPDGFYDGGFTGNGNSRDIAGPAHFNEYVVPEKVLFGKDPIIPYMIDYMEAARNGRNPSSSSSNSSSTTTAPINQNTTNSANNEMFGLIYEVKLLLQELKEKDFIAWLVNDIPTAKKIKEGQKKLEKLTNQAKK